MKFFFFKIFDLEYYQFPIATLEWKRMQKKKKKYTWASHMEQW